VVAADVERGLDEAKLQHTGDWAETVTVQKTATVIQKANFIFACICTKHLREESETT
jgi:hypothetical protein